MFTFLRLLFLAIIENCGSCFTYSKISFLLFLTFWIYCYTITNFQVIVRYFPFCKKILSFCSFSSAVSGPWSIEKLYPLKEKRATIVSGLGSLLYKSKTEIFLLNQILGCSRKKHLHRRAQDILTICADASGSDSFTSSHVLLYMNRCIDVSTLVLDEAVIYRCKKMKMSLYSLQTTTNINTSTHLRAFALANGYF